MHLRGMGVLAHRPVHFMQNAIGEEWRLPLFYNYKVQYMKHMYILCAVIGWEDGEEDGRPGRRSPTLTSHHDACDGGADQLR